MSTVYKYKIYCNTESLWVEGWDTVVPTNCFNNNGHTIDTNFTTQIDLVKSNDVNIISTDTYGNIGDVTSDEHGHLHVKAMDEGIFGEGKITKYNPIVQNYAPYGMINHQLYKTYTETGGTITSASNGCDIQLDITNSVGSYAVLRSHRVLKYRPGYSNIVRFCQQFDTPVANSLQFGGVGNAGSDLYFCYNGTEFGIRKSCDGLAEVRKLSISVSENTTATGTITLDDIEFEVSLTNSCGYKNFTAYEIKNGATYSGWNVENIGNDIVFQAHNVGAKSGTFSFTSDGASVGSFTQLKAGAALSSSYVTKANWNGSSSMINTLDPLKRNMYEIEYSWYGVGNILFKILNPITGRYELVHSMSFANTVTLPSLTQPNMFCQMGVASLGSTTALTNYITGQFGATLGKINVIAPIYGVSNKRTIPANTEQVIITVKNRNTINGYSNQSEIYIERISAVINGSKPVHIKVIKNPTTLSNSTIADYTNYKYIEKDQSIGLYDKDSLKYTGGSIIDEFYIGKNGLIYLNLKNKEYELYQSDIIIFTAESGNTNTVEISVTLLEDL